MFSRIGNRKKIILSTLFMVLLIWGVQGVRAADLEVSLETTTPNVQSGGTISFTATITKTTADASQHAFLSIYSSGSSAGPFTNLAKTANISRMTGDTNTTQTLPIKVDAPTVTAETVIYYEAEITPTTSGDIAHSRSSAVRVTVGAGSNTLSVSVVPSQSSVVPGQIFTLNAIVRNTGTTSSGSLSLRAYQRSGGTDTPIGTDVSVSSIRSQATRSVPVATVTASTFPGTYSYLVKISNPAIVSPLTYVTVTNPVDLSVSTPSVDKSTVAPGETFTLSTTVTNIGTGSFTRSTTLRYFQSTDTTLNRMDGSDTEVGTDPIGGLGSYLGYNDATNESITLTAPSEPGTYYYFAYVVPVHGEQYYNYNYNYNYYYNYRDTLTNNTSSYVTVTVSAPPDLTVNLFRPRQLTFAPGERFTLDATVSNVGTGTSAATQLRVYEDGDDSRYRREQQITRQSVSAISAGSSSSVSISLTAPLDGGVYYYRVSVDTVTGETETNNNTSNWIGIDVLEPLVLESLRASKAALRSGESFTLTATVKNDGTARSDGTTVRYYRSDDNSLSSRDTRVDSSSVSGLAAGGTTQVSTSLTAPQSPGTYYYGACVGDSQTYSGDACKVIRLTVLAVVLPESERPPMYWIDTEAGVLQSLTGPDVQRLVQSVQNATGIVVDIADDRIYWIEQTGDRSGRIQSANVDGTNPRVVKELTSVPMGIALDAANGTVYITNGWGKVQSIGVDGGNFQPDLITGLDAPRGIAVDAAGGKIYWTEQTSETTGKIQSADLNGANVREVLRQVAGMPKAIAVDAANGKLYVANAQGQVQRLNLDGSGFQSHFIQNLSAPQGVAVDTAAGKIYWTEAGRIRRANLDGTNRQNVVTGLGTPASLSISSAPC